MIARYFFWLMVWHILSFYKQSPVSFIIGLFATPFNFITRVLAPTECHAEMVRSAVATLKGYWYVYNTLPRPPAFIERKFTALEQEASKLA